MNNRDYLEKSDLTRIKFSSRRPYPFEKIKICDEYLRGHLHFPQKNVQKSDLEKGLENCSLIRNPNTGEYCIQKKKPYVMDLV